jgi:hypothetical protein
MLPPCRRHRRARLALQWWRRRPAGIRPPPPLRWPPATRRRSSRRRAARLRSRAGATRATARGVGADSAGPRLAVVVAAAGRVCRPGGTAARAVHARDVRRGGPGVMTCGAEARRRRRALTWWRESRVGRRLAASIAHPFPPRWCH